LKAVLVTRFGSAAEVAEVADVPDPGPPGPGQVLLDILAAPINPSDFLVFQGRFGPTPPPCLLPPAARLSVRSLRSARVSAI
jgi:NADPH:quinone reductase-like Zn-dependent oxidoreductase